MCNALVHAYLDIDYGKVEIALSAAPEHFGEYVRQVARWLAANADGAAD